jgi:uncharacterized protein DUF4232
MRPARIIATVVFAAAVAVTGCSAHSTATNPSPAPGSGGSTAPPATRSPSGAGSATGSSTASPSGGHPVTGRCDASALAGSVQGTEGTAGHIWYTVRLRNASARTCTVEGIPGVRLLGSQGQPVTAPSVPGGPVGSPVVLRPGQAASFAFSEPNACDRFATGSRLLVTLPQGRGSLVVGLGGQARFGTCASVQVRTLAASTTPTPAASPLADRISDPQVAADRLVAAWMGGDRAAARKLTTQAVTDRLFGEAPPADSPKAQPCRLVDLGLFLCSYPLAAPNELSVWVRGGASAGYGVSGIEFVD